MASQFHRNKQFNNMLQEPQDDSKLERTLAIIKPDAAHREDAIVSRIEKRRRVHMTMDQASDFYTEHQGKPFFEGLTRFMSSGAIVVMVLAKPGAISAWRKLLGPTDANKARQSDPSSIRALFGTDGQRNACHGSDSPASAEREIRFFFPNTTTEPLPNKETARAMLETALYPVLTKGLTELCKQKPANPTEWLGQWLLHNNPNKPKVVEPEDA